MFVLMEDTQQTDLLNKINFTWNHVPTACSDDYTAHSIRHIALRVKQSMPANSMPDNWHAYQSYIACQAEIRLC